MKTYRVIMIRTDALYCQFDETDAERALKKVVEENARQERGVEDGYRCHYEKCFVSIDYTHLVEIDLRDLNPALDSTLLEDAKNTGLTRI